MSAFAAPVTHQDQGGCREKELKRNWGQVLEKELGSGLEIGKGIGKRNWGQVLKYNFFRKRNKRNWGQVLKGIGVKRNWGHKRNWGQVLKYNFFTEKELGSGRLRRRGRLTLLVMLLMVAKNNKQRHLLSALLVSPCYLKYVV